MPQKSEQISKTARLPFASVARAAVRRVLLPVHLFVGLTAGLLFCLMGLSGSLLVFRHEIDRALHPTLLRRDLNVSDTGGGGPCGVEPASLARVVAVAQKALPGVPVQHLFVAHSSSDGVHEVWFRGTSRRVYVEPCTYAVRGIRDTKQDPLEWLFGLHTKLHQGEAGERVVGWGGVLLAAMSVSGLILWWPARWRQWAERLRVRWKNARLNSVRVTLDLHRSVGFYSAVLLFLSALTGTSLIFDEAFAGAAYRITGGRSAPERPKVFPPVQEGAAASLSLSALLQRADAALPGGEIGRISFPSAPEGPLVVRKRFAGDLHPNGIRYIYLDPYRGEVLRVDIPTNAALRLMNSRYPLHIGQWGGGSISRLLTALAGIAPTVLFITGLWTWQNRRRRHQASRTVSRGA